jgi:hypothetical protein
MIVMAAYKCPHCGKKIDEVKEIELEVGLNRRDSGIVLGLGLGLGIMCAAAWSYSGWGVLAAFIVVVAVLFMVMAYVNTKRRAKEMEE